MDRMIGRAVIGAVAGAVVLFILGFVFYATPLQNVAVASADDAQAAAVQQAMAANLPRTGTYFVPDAGTAAQTGMYSQGPIATIHYNMGGFAVAAPEVMIAGFVQLLVVAGLMAAALLFLGRHVGAFADRMKIAGLGIVAATVFMRLGPPIWYHQDWTWAIYAFVCDSISLGAAALVILKLLPQRTAPAVAS